MSGRRERARPKSQIHLFGLVQLSTLQWFCWFQLFRDYSEERGNDDVSIGIKERTGELHANHCTRACLSKFAGRLNEIIVTGRIGEHPPPEVSRSPDVPFYLDQYPLVRKLLADLPDGEQFRLSI
jgi:hypothetical protein